MTMLVAAIDCGGTKTQAALADRHGAVHFLPPQAGCSPQDGPAWHGRMSALMQAMTQAGALRAVVLGMAGHDEVPAHDAATAKLAAALLGPGVRILNDVALALRAACGDGPGVLVLAGTGSMAMAQGPLGIARAGGWGDLIGDEGSAYWIGARALRLAARALDGQMPDGPTPDGPGGPGRPDGPDGPDGPGGRDGDTAFARALMQRLGVAPSDDPTGPLRYAMQGDAPRAAVAQVARHVDAMAAQGQPTAIAILTRGAGHLARAARAAALGAGLDGSAPWSTAGSVMRSATLRAELARRMGSAECPAQMTALGGGLRLAAVDAGWQPGSGWIARVAAATRAWV